MFKHILVPLDGSRFGSRALRYASEIATLCGAEVTLLQVVNPAAPIPSASTMLPGVVSGETTELSVQVAFSEDRRNISKARRYMAGKVRDLKAKKIACNYEVVLGDPAEVILRYTRKRKYDAVVMTTHGKSGLKRVFMGSVADEVIRKSKKPVLVIRPPSR